MKKKRVLWLLNHDTLSKFELPLIRDLGFEIYTPKSALKEIFNASGSITYDYDSTLTIPVEDLNLLNEYDFFSTNNMPLYIKKILNYHFDIAITYTDTSFAILRKLIHNFEGHIFFRAFGIGPSIFKNYTDLFNYYFTENDQYRLKQIGDRFRFSQCYPNLAEIEDKFHQNRSVYMPLGLPQDFYNIENEWNGKSKKLLFFCTRIKYTSEAEAIYNKFKKDFSKFDYIIAGNQPTPVNDSRVTGYLDRDELNTLFLDCRVMYYHSTNPRHLHYHPLEAMIAGMPVIYMKGGLLEFLANDTKQSGCSRTVKEAKEKITRIMNDDQQFILEIIEDQKQILDKFSYAYVKKQWEQNFLSVVKKSDYNKTNDDKRIALFTSDNQLELHIDDYLKQALILSKGLKRYNDSHSLTLNILSSASGKNDVFNLVKDQDVQLREFELVAKPLEKVKESLSLLYKNEALWYNSYLMPKDNAHNYTDFDYWLFLNDDLEWPIAPIKPYGIFVENLADRFYETLSILKVSNYKNAAFLFTSSEQTKMDLVKYLGIENEKISVVPYIFSNEKKHTELDNMNYILLEIDAKKKKQIEQLVKIISEYYRISTKTTKLKIHFNGDQNVKSIIDYYREQIEKDELDNKVDLYGELNQVEYEMLYANASMVMFPHNLKNLTWKITKAMQYGKKIALKPYPFIKEIDENFNYNFAYIDSSERGNFIYKLLSNITEFENQMTIRLPDNDEKVIDCISEVWRKLL